MFNLMFLDVNDNNLNLLLMEIFFLDNSCYQNKTMKAVGLLLAEDKDKGICIFSKVFLIKKIYMRT